MNLRPSIALAGVLLLIPIGGSAQTSTSQISGTVIDPSGASVPSATVTLTNQATGVAQRQTTTDAGLFAFSAIPVGAYTVKVEARGFKAYQSHDNIVQVSTPLAVNIQLEVGAVGESWT